MKTFHFPLERVLTWRRSQVTSEEIKLERLRAGLKALRQQEIAVTASRASMETEILRSASVQGMELRELDRVRHWEVVERRRLAGEAAAAEKAIVAQEAVVTAARRRVRLIERLKERRIAAWRADFDREMDELAGEFAISQWRRAD